MGTTTLGVSGLRPAPVSTPMRPHLRYRWRSAIAVLIGSLLVVPPALVIGEPAGASEPDEGVVVLDLNGWFEVRRVGYGGLAWPLLGPERPDAAFSMWGSGHCTTVRDGIPRELGSCGISAGGNLRPTSIDVDADGTGDGPYCGLSSGSLSGWFATESAYYYVTGAWRDAVGDTLVIRGTAQKQGSTSSQPFSATLQLVGFWEQLYPYYTCHTSYGQWWYYFAGSATLGDVDGPVEVVPGSVEHSRECLWAGGTRVLDSTTEGVRAFLYTYQTPSGETWVCARVEDTRTGTGYGGRLRVDPAGALPRVSGGPGQPSVDAQSSACATTTPNQVPGTHPISQGGVLTLDYMLDAYASDTEAWLCLEAGSTKARVVVPRGNPPTVDFGTAVVWEPDPGTPPT